jgi:DNA helicase II / ATP-dependent DNA helicase PcrA
VDGPALLEGLTEAQRRAVTSDAAPLCVLAGPGSGKTRVLTRRIAYLAAEGRAAPRHVLALTFTRRAAGELTRRLRGLGVRDAVAAGTFHAVAFASLRQWWADQGRPSPTLVERPSRLLARVRAAARLDPGLPLADVAGEIEWARSRLVDPDGYEAAALAARRRPAVPVPTVALLYARYEAEKRRRGLVDFHDLVVRCGDALLADPDFAARQRWRFRHVFVDEYQDVNPAQARLLEAWRGDRLDLFVVGDPNQAIYGWNGADPGLLDAFPDRFPSAAVLSLDDNFRSTPEVVAVATAVLAAAGGRPRPQRGHRAEGPAPSVRAFPSEHAEARAVADDLRRRRTAGAAWSHHAVLFRSHAQAAALEAALTAAGVPHRLRGSRSFLDAPEAQALLGDLRNGAVPLRVWVADLEALARGDGPGGPAPDGAAADELARLGRELLEHDPGATAESFRAWLGAAARADGDDPAHGTDAVELATFHAAKGLEWPVVFVVGVEDGLVPISRATTRAARDEERRLLYVAVTRAVDELHCSWAHQRSFGAHPVPRSPSPWLSAVDTAVAGLVAGDGERWRSELAATRRHLRARPGSRSTRPGLATVGADADPAVLAALEDWRRAAARAAGVPGHVILHDTTLRLVAEARPRDRDALVRLPGLGPVKADRFGDAVLAVVAEHRAS